ncbi:LacI family DNA-binding transcriptional regulator [Secundilactobacillus yichangensis]|uniref:LacI family DNA-binding transcriptional regulator n=1 Tax=Secundilactobacillus yichangensis TaxID=2799580 RepID=UPI0019413F67|nr:LacI family DNA-binding transcriptional regulator [Secundilactobacillus yichangensis]
MENITIMTIAKIAHVSHTTVSRALNDSPLVKEKTKQRIRQIADEMGYVPNLNAKGLVKNQSFLIGIFFSEMKTGTSPSFLVDVMNKARESLPKGYIISVDSMDNYSEQALPTNRYDGVIVVSQSTDDDDFIETLASQQVPLVVLNRKLERDDVVNYATDDYLGAQMLLRYAVRMGHKKFGIIEGQSRFISSLERRRAFNDVMAENHFEVLPDHIKNGNYLPESGYLAMKEMLTVSQAPTCVFVANDDMAIGAIRACNDLGYRVPEDISILGFDDMGYTKYLVPRLTTVSKPTPTLVETGVSALTKLLKDVPVSTPKRVFPPTLVIRDSVKNLRNETQS